jgi:histidinol-phosphate phosphatase family protein
MDSLRPAIFLDKDGTLIQNVPYNVDPARVQLMPGALDALRLFQAAGFALVIVSNQSGVAKGLFSEGALRDVEARLRGLFETADILLAGFYYCPHHPAGTIARYARICECRKPEPGLLLRAARELKLDLPRSWMIGDLLNDVEAGHRAGCRAVLFNSGGETEWLPGPQRTPEFETSQFVSAASWILQQPSTSDQHASGEPRNVCQPC